MEIYGRGLRAAVGVDRLMRGFSNDAAFFPCANFVTGIYADISKDIQPHTLSWPIRNYKSVFNEETQRPVTRSIDWNYGWLWGHIGNKVWLVSYRVPLTSIYLSGCFTPIVVTSFVPDNITVVWRNYVVLTSLAYKGMSMRRPVGLHMR